MNRDEYEAKLEEKRRRMLERAERADEEARASAMGQSVLVGHQSERRHRRDLDRIDRKASDADGPADDLRRGAETIGSTVSSEDPDAIDKLEASRFRGSEGA